MKSKNRDLTMAISVANMYHLNQVRDGSGLPYIIHPLAVMSNVNTLDEKIVAVLHDTVEDCDCSLDDLRRFRIEEHTIDAVNAISKRNGEKQEDYLDRVMTNELAYTVKLVDIKHNMSDMSLIEPKTEARWRAKYEKSLRHLKNGERKCLYIEEIL